MGRVFGGTSSRVRAGALASLAVAATGMLAAEPANAATRGPVDRLLGAVLAPVGPRLTVETLDGPRQGERRTWTTASSGGPDLRPGTRYRITATVPGQAPIVRETATPRATTASTAVPAPPKVRLLPGKAYHDGRDPVPPHQYLIPTALDLDPLWVVYEQAFWLVISPTSIGSGLVPESRALSDGRWTPASCGDLNVCWSLQHPRGNVVDVIEYRLRDTASNTTGPSKFGVLVWLPLPFTALLP
ncbi:hypothetical protein [Patulibacter defluvii]|uniref:hypothetical protein n=1 Tax=Patulibacter defluvii TaxID=3095358 RepID=UPI002A75EF52|nr:hypothetical protein [Patulibacter sp. DM4]